MSKIGVIVCALVELAGARPVVAQRSPSKLAAGGAPGVMPKCPAKGGTLVPTGGSGGPMTAPQTAAFLAQVRKDAAALETPEAVRALDASVTAAARSGKSTPLSVALFVNGYPNAAAMAFADGASKLTAGVAAGARASAWSNLGAALDAAEHRTQAVAAFEQAIAIGGRTFPAVMGLAVAHANAGDLSGAEPLLKEATRLAPTESAPWLALANVLSCEGQMGGALAAARSAQTVTWDATEQERIDQADRAAGNQPASDDDPNAPVPMPPGRSPFAGYGRSQRGPQFAIPNVPGDIFAYVKQAPAFLAMMEQYSTESSTHMALADKDYDPSDDELPAASGPTGAPVFVIRYRNDYVAKRAASVVMARSTAKIASAIEEFGNARQRLLAEAMENQKAIDATQARCKSAASSSDESLLCDQQNCRALTGLYQGMQKEWVPVFSTLYGAYATSAAKYDKAMRAWLDYATSPGVQYSLDQERRGQLAALQSEAFTQITTGFGPVCNPPPPGSRMVTPTKKDDSGTEKPGPCNKVKIDAPKVASLEANCHELTFSPDLDLDMGLGVKVHFKRANGKEPGSLYIGAGWDFNAGLVEATDFAGFKMTWDESGVVTGSGGTIEASVSVDQELATEINEAMQSGKGAPKTPVSSSLTIQGGYDLVNHTAFEGVY